MKYLFSLKKSVYKTTQKKLLQLSSIFYYILSNQIINHQQLTTTHSHNPLFPFSAKRKMSPKTPRAVTAAPAPAP